MMRFCSLFLTVAVSISALSSPIHAQGPEREYRDYVDPKYHFTFRYPSDWTRDDQPKPGAGGETRVIVRDPQSTARGIASIGQVGTAISKAQLATPEERERIVQGMIDVTLKQIYQRTSQEMKATKMMVGSKQELPSNTGIKFYISTAQVIGTDTLVIAGIHIIPYDQPYMVTFMMLSPFKVGSGDQSVINKVVNSFRLLSEIPKK